MTRPRWHDVVIVVGILALGGAGVWALWGATDPPAPAPAPRASGQT